MPPLVLKGLEHVYDAFDEYEHPNLISLGVPEMSLPEAIMFGQSLLQDLVDRERREGGYMSTGSFIAELTRIEDDDGYIFYQNADAIKKGLRYFGGELEDYRDVAARFVFLSYSHRDEGFANKLVKSIEQFGLRTWFDRNDLITETSLLRFGTSIEQDTLLMRTLENALDRANRVLLVLSRHSVQSTWVEAEIALALQEGRRENIPVDCLLLERDILNNSPNWITSAVQAYGCYDFSDWQEDLCWNSSFKKLLKVAFRYKGSK